MSKLIYILKLGFNMPVLVKKSGGIMFWCWVKHLNFISRPNFG